MKKSILAAIVGLAAFSLNAATYYVDYANGDDAAAGLSEAPWKTLAYAVAQATDGDEIILAKGIHNTASTSGTTLAIDKELRIRGAGENWETILDYGHKTKDYITFSKNGALLSNLTFYRLGSAYQNDLVTLNADATISNVVFTSCMNPTGNNKEIILMKNGLLTHCWFTNNIAVYNAGIQMAGGIVENCVFADNEVKTSNMSGAIINIQSGNGVIRNCTIVNNKLPGVCHALYSYAWDSSKGKQRVYNCIIMNNYDPSNSATPKNWTLVNNTSTWRNNCTTPLTGLKGTGNFDDDPAFKEDGLHLLVSSPCLVNGLSGTDAEGFAYAATFDMDGNPRGTPPAVGAFEYAAAAKMELTPKSSATFVRAPETIRLWCETDGSYTEPLTYVWSTGGRSVTNELTDIGIYENISVTVTDANGQSETATFDGSFYVHPAGIISAYVDYATGDDTASGTIDAPWKTLTNALDSATIANGDEIILRRGTHPVTASIDVEKAVTIRGEGANNETVLDANNGVVDNPQNPLALTFTIKVSGVVVRDLTFTRFGKSGQSEPIRINADAVISNCVFTGCFGEGMTSCGRVVSLQAGLLTGCFITNNVASENAGVYIPQTGLAPTTIENCLIAFNRTSGANENGAFLDSRCYTHATTIRSCTIANNSRAVAGVAVFPWIAQSFENNIIWGNVCETNATIDCNWKVRAGQSSNWTANCTTRVDELNGADNIEANPKFSKQFPGLLSISPCRDAGRDDLAPPTTVDIFGKSRTFGRHIDIGCAECQNAGNLIFIID